MKDGVENWLIADMPNVPQRQKGVILELRREHDGVWFRVLVEKTEVITDYIGRLSKAGFSFDAEPILIDDPMQFYAFKDSSILSFAYKGSEKCVYIEYLRRLISV